MAATPPIDWAVLTPQLPNGSTVCVTHGLVDAEQAPIGIPICPHCQQSVTVTDRDRHGVLRGAVYPPPARCARGHPLIGGRMTVGWIPCRCPATDPGPNGHQAWWCTVCTDGGRSEPEARLCWPPIGPDCAERHRRSAR